METQKGNFLHMDAYDSPAHHHEEYFYRQSPHLRNGDYFDQSIRK